MCDCTIRLDGKEEEYQAHRAVLASASEFFLNAFTSGMQEDAERCVTIPANYTTLFDKIYQFCYSGRLDIIPEEVVQLLDYASYFGISTLTDLILKVLKENMSKELLSRFINDCYSEESQSALNQLIPVIQSVFYDFTISELSDLLDVETFCKVLAGIEITNKETVTAWMDEFLGDWELNEKERNAVKDLISKFD